MTRILLVKTSSLGDVVHNLPVLNDIRRHVADAEIHWAVEEAYAPLVALHPDVHRIFPVAVRRWRRQPVARGTWRELNGCRRELAETSFDAVIDTQGLVKSALIACLARGCRHGFDAQSAREPLAAMFYQVTHRVARGLHAVERNRQLVARALAYDLDSPVDYGLASVPPGPDEVRPGRQAVLLHASSRTDKLWPEDHWAALGEGLAAGGWTCVLPWGDAAERSRSERIAARIPTAVVPGAQDVVGMARLLACSDLVIGVDTGLLHLAAALGRPVVGLYTATDPVLTGVHGAARAVNLGGVGQSPRPERVMEAVAGLGVAGIEVPAVPGRA